MNRNWSAGLGLAGCSGLCLLAAALPAAAQGPGLEAMRLTAGIERERERRWEPLSEAGHVYDHERVRTTAGARAELQIARSGRIVLGGDTQLRVHSTDQPDPPARMGLARVVLERGSALIDTSNRAGVPPADLRLNIGDMRLRVFGSQVWAEANPAGEEICLLNGAVEILTPGATERLDRSGECLRWGSKGAQRLNPTQAGAMHPRLARTAFETANPSAMTPAVVVPPPAVAAVSDEPAHREPLSLPPPPPAATAGDVAVGRWALVLASFPTLDAAERAVLQFADRGVDARIEPADSRGRLTYRVTHGDFESRAAALQALNQRGGALSSFKQAWPSQRP